jgi:hypothetical protein
MSWVRSILNSRIRGVRIFEVLTFVCLVLLVFWVYLTKAGASRERAQIADVEQRIGDEERRVKLLRAEDAKLEQPARIESLSEGAGLKPVDAAHEADPSTLAAIADDKPRADAKSKADPSKDAAR